jgi:hypothetical protein
MSKYKLKWIKSDDESTDSYYEFSDNKGEEITIQSCFYAYPDIWNVNVWDKKNKTMKMYPCKTLARAKNIAIENQAMLKKAQI